MRTWTPRHIDASRSRRALHLPFAMRARMRLMKSLIAASAASGASRCGACRTPGQQRDVDRAIALGFRDLDLPYRSVLIVGALNDLNGDADIGEIFADIPVAKFRVEPGVIPAAERIVDIRMPAAPTLA